MQRFISYFIVLSIMAVFVSCQGNSDPLSAENKAAEFSKQGSDAADILNKQNGVYTYSVTIENLTPATGPGASQPLSPPVFATHKSNFKVFKIGHFASDALAQVAEDAQNADLISELSSSSKVFDVQQIGAAPIFPGSSMTATITAKKRYDKLSLVAMLVNTNDAFAGMNAVNLPSKGTRTVYLRAFDAGSEKNTESFNHIPGPCCGNPLVRVPSHERIKYHKGITGYGDLDPAVYGWDEPVAKVTITKL